MINLFSKSMLLSVSPQSSGKREDISLREKEKEIQKDLDDGIDHLGKKGQPA